MINLRIECFVRPEQEAEIQFGLYLVLGAITGVFLEQGADQLHARPGEAIVSGPVYSYDKVGMTGKLGARWDGRGDWEEEKASVHHALLKAFLALRDSPPLKRGEMVQLPIRNRKVRIQIGYFTGPPPAST